MFFYYIWYFKVLVSLYLVLKNLIDYRTQANAGGNPGEVGKAGRVLTELAHSGIGSVEVAW